MKTVVIVSDVLVGEQVNGVGTWLINTQKELEKLGHKVIILNALYFKYTFPLPSYPEIRLVASTRNKVGKILETFKPDHIHIATEGTLGFMARSFCIKNNWKFTTSYHTRFPEYVFTRTKLLSLQCLTYKFMRYFHSKSEKVIVTTESLKKELEDKKFRNVNVVPLGVDTDLFTKNNNSNLLQNIEKPIFVYFGRLAPEKNVEDFLKAKLLGSKLVIGDGPSRKELERKYKDTANFVGYKTGQELVDTLSACDVFITPSKSETFGLTIIEALACGLPVVAYDVQGPNDIVTNGLDGYIGDNLTDSAMKCLSIDPKECRKTAKKYSWKFATLKFFNILSPR